MCNSPQHHNLTPTLFTPSSTAQWAHTSLLTGMSNLRKGAWVWVEGAVAGEGARVAGRVRSTNGDTGEITVEPFWGELCDTCCELPEYNGGRSRPKLLSITRGGPVSIVSMSSSNVEGRADMMELADLNVGELMHNLRIRYKANPMAYYTWVGDILIVLNPMAPTGMADRDHMEMYADSSFGDPSLDPHIFAVAERAYTRVVQTGMPQAVIISGESGAGKTVSTRHVLDFLAFRSSQAQNDDTGGSSLSMLGAASEVLEALGNSKTLRNHNSSRFGKFVKIYFRPDAPGVIQGAHIVTYLLEKSRIVDQDDGERNYHVFYLLLQFLPEDKRDDLGLDLGSVEDYRYLINSKGTNCDSWRVQPDAARTPMEDPDRWLDLSEAIETLGLHDVFDSVWTICAAVLHLGTLSFDPPEEDATSPMCSISNENVVLTIARLLQIEPDALREALLSCRVVNEKRAYSVSAARANVDALAKSIYSHMFDHVVTAINAALSGSSGSSSALKGRRWIGVLDIFGFESFQDPLPPPEGRGKHAVVDTANTFEQLCINLTNERLQRFFYDELIPKQLEHYREEGIDVDAIVYDDNALCVDALMEGRKGVLSLLDDATRTATSLPKYRENPEDGDNLWVTRVAESYPESKDNLVVDRTGVTEVSASERTRSGFLGWFDEPLDDRSQSSFCVHHYAGTVWYSARDAVDKNSDRLAHDAVALLSDSGMAWLAAGYDPVQSAEDRASVARGFARQLRALVCPPSWGSAANVSGGELDAAANPLFVRCVKPICRKQPGNTQGWLEDHKVLDQLRSAGMYAVIQMRQAGYPTELDKREFLDMYWELEEDVKALMDLRSEDEQIHHLARLIASDPNVVLGDLRGMPPYQVGKTKVFMKESMASAMATTLRAVQDSKLARMEAAGLHLKALARAALTVRRLPELRAAAAERFEYLKRKRAFISQGLTPEQADEAIKREDEEAALREKERYLRKHYAPLQAKVDESDVPGLLAAMAKDMGLEGEAGNLNLVADLEERAAKLDKLAQSVQAVLDVFREDVYNADVASEALAGVHKLRKRVKREEALLREQAERREAEARAAAEAARRAEVFQPAVEQLAELGVEQAIALLDEFPLSFAPVVDAGKISLYDLDERRDRLERNLGRAKSAFQAWSEDLFSERREGKARAWIRRLRNLLGREDSAMENDLAVVARYSKVTQVRAKLEAKQEAKRAAQRARRDELLAEAKAKARAEAAAAKAEAEAEVRKSKAKARRLRKRARQRTRFLRKLRVSAPALSGSGYRVLYDNMACEIRYVGPITFNLAKRDEDYDVRKDPIYVGLEAPVGKHSYTSGAIAGVKYFTCQQQHGVFVKPDKLWVIDPIETRGVPLRVGDLVWHAESRFLRTGRVLFVGRTHFSETEPVVGVSLDQEEAMGNTDGTVDGVRYFDVDFSRGMFFPMAECYRIAGWDQGNADGVVNDYCALHDLDVESDSGYMSDDQVEELLFESGMLAAEDFSAALADGDDTSDGRRGGGDVDVGYAVPGTGVYDDDVSSWGLGGGVGSMGMGESVGMGSGGVDGGGRGGGYGDSSSSVCFSMGLGSV